MSNSILTPNYRFTIASEFLDSFAREDVSYYLFIGKILPWANEASPNVGDTSIVTQKDAWNSMISAKRLRGDSVRLVIPRTAWTANVIYTPYDDNNPTYYTNTSNKIYVVTANNEVYKCIDNANTANSTIEPIGNNNNSGFVKMQDGYLWKYMFTVASEVNDSAFVTSDYIPVPLTQVGTTAVVPGTIDRIIVTDPGFGYNGANAGIDLAIVTITGDGSGATAVANVGLTGNISSVTVTSQGTGYTYANVTFAGGVGATARAIISPVNGHGFAPAEELNAKQVLLAGRIGRPDSTEGGTFTIQNDFRQFGIIKNPYKYNTTEIANSNSVSQTVDITIVEDNSPDFAIDDFVFQIDANGSIVFSGNVVDIGNQSNTAIVKVTQATGVVQVGNLMFNTNSVKSKRVQSFSNPPLERYSGQVLYFENILAVQRNNNQAEVFKVLFDF